MPAYPAQSAQGKRIRDKIEGGESALLFKGATGMGKTVTVGVAVRANKSKEVGFYVAKDATLARAHCKPVGAHDKDGKSFTLSKNLKDLTRQLSDPASTRATYTMTPNMLQAMGRMAVSAGSGEGGEAKGLLDLLALLKEKDVTRLVFWCDEPHNLYQYERSVTPAYMAALRALIATQYPSIALVVVGITATPMYDADSAPKRLKAHAEAFFGTLPAPTTWTPEEHTALALALRPYPEKPKWTRVELDPPT